MVGRLDTASPPSLEHTWGGSITPISPGVQSPGGDPPHRGGGSLVVHELGSCTWYLVNDMYAEPWGLSIWYHAGCNGPPLQGGQTQNGVREAIARHPKDPYAHSRRIRVAGFTVCQQWGHAKER